MPRSKDEALSFRYLYHDIDHEEEETFLNQKSRDGWELQGFKSGYFYSFKKSAAGGMVYRMDYKEHYNEDYVTLTEDAGWTLAAVRNVTRGVWYYFCRKAGDDASPALFTDISSKISMLKKIQKRMITSISIWIIVIIASVVLIFLSNDSHVLSFISGFLLGLSLVAIVLLIISNRRIMSKIRLLEEGRF